MLEKDVEKKICQYAKSKGFLTYKFTSPARASVPDRLIISERGDMFFMEMKRPGGKCTTGQEREIARLKQQEVAVFVVDNVEYGKQLIDAAIMGLDMKELMP